ncbi:MAG TPA: HlyU family transcriptional regulator [Xanthobacteraceae bacterium]|nr:HlyU family transcriptional regulator [Xanthobacteraceae bacterium]
MRAQARDNRLVIPRADGMFSKLKAAWSRLAGQAFGGGEEAPTPAVEYKGYRIRATPYRNNGVYQTAGTIEKDTPEGVKEHRFIRADTHQGREDAIAFAISKAKQIIDLQGDRIFAKADAG